VIVEDQAIIGGLVGVHQFVRVGRLSITGGCAKIVQDVPPFMTADGNPLAVRGINKIGLERQGLTPEAIRSLKEAYRILYRRKLGVQDAVKEIQDALVMNAELKHLIDFVLASERGITR
jgi:UDP-N-acetylglucosamine acyltransferase